MPFISPFSSTQNKYFDKIFAFLILIFLLFAGVYPIVHTISIFLPIALLCYLIYLKSTSRLYDLSKIEKLVFISFLCFSLSIIPSFIYSRAWEAGLRELDVPMKWLLLSIILLLVFKTNLSINPRFLKFLFGLGGIILGLISGYFYLILGEYNHYALMGEGRLNPLRVFSGIFTIITFVLSTQKHNTSNQNIFFCISFLLSSLALAATGGRSVFVGVLLGFMIIFFIVIKFKDAFNVKRLLIMALISCLISVFAYVESGRYNYTKYEMSYIQDGGMESSAGARVRMWKEGYAIFILSPIFGMSAAEQERNKDRIENISHTEFNKINNFFGTKHNELITAASEKGIIGVFSLIFLYFTLIYICFKYRNEFGMIGLGIISVYMGSGLFGEPLVGKNESIFFGILFALLLPLILSKPSTNVT